jgi:hypothetical protein
MRDFFFLNEGNFLYLVENKEFDSLTTWSKYKITTRFHSFTDRTIPSVYD